MIVQTGVTLAARGNGADNDPLTELIAGDANAEFGNDADGFMADGQTRFDRIFAFEDMYIRTANRRGRDFDQCLTRTDFRNRFFVENDLTRFDKNCRFHGSHRQLLPYMCSFGQGERNFFRPTGKALLETAG